MQNDYFHQDPPPSSNAANIDSHSSDDENISSSNQTSHIDVEMVGEKEHDDDDDEKHIETGVDNDKPFIQVFVPDDSSTFSFDEELPYRESQQQQQQQTHTNSHDSLLQPDYHLMDTMNTAASSTDDLSTTHQLSASVFHSKDSALGLSDDNLNLPSTNPFLIKDEDEEEEEEENNDDDDDHHPEHILLTSSSLLQSIDDNQSKYRTNSLSFFLLLLSNYIRQLNVQ